MYVNVLLVFKYLKHVYLSVLCTIYYASYLYVFTPVVFFPMALLCKAERLGQQAAFHQGQGQHLKIIVYFAS